MTRPSVTVVIPTKGSGTAGIAADSAHAQQSVDVEVLVVVDATCRADFDQIAGCLPDGTRAIQLPPGYRGGAAAREIGTRAGRGEYVAYLDDDDVWLPDKLRRQVDALEQRSARLISCRAVLASPYELSRARPEEFGALATERRPVPRRAYDGEELSRWLFHNRRLLGGRNLLHTSTLLLRRGDACDVGWRCDLQRHQDWDFVLRLCTACGTNSIVQLDEVLAVLGTGSGQSISGSDDWRTSLDWCENAAELFDDAARADFLVGQVVRYCLRQGDVRAALRVAHRALRLGRPTASAWILGLAGVVPRGLFERVTLRMSGRRGVTRR